MVRGFGALAGLLVLASIAGMPRCYESGMVRENEPELVIPPGPPPSFGSSLLERLDYGPCVSTRAEPNTAAPRCVFDDAREFRVWVDSSHEVTLRIDGLPIGAQIVDSDSTNGTTLSVHLPSSASHLEILANDGERWDVSLQALSCTACHDPDGARVRGEIDRIHEELDSAFREHHATRPDVWLSMYERTDAEFARNGILSERVDLANRFAFAFAREANDGETALDLIRRLEPAAAYSPHDRALLAYFAGIVEWQRGHMIDAARAFRIASRHAAHIADHDLGVGAFPMYATTLADLGHFHAALHWAQRAVLLSETRGDPCNLATNLRTVGWVHLVLREHGWSSADPRPLLARALAISGPEGSCPAPARTGGARLSLATIALHEGQPEQAFAEVLRIDSNATTPDERMRIIDVELRARMALRHDPAALADVSTRLGAAAEAVGTPESHWILAMRQGDRLAAGGDRPGALAAYLSAEGQLDHMAELMGFGLERTSTGARDRETTAELVDLLLRDGDLEGAFCTARRSEARQRQAALVPELLPAAQREQVIRRVEHYTQARNALETLSQWGQSQPRATYDEALVRVGREQDALEQELAEVLRLVRRTIRRPRCDELASPDEGELFIGVYPLGAGWSVFAADRSGVHHHELRVVDPETLTSPRRLSELVLVPLGGGIGAAKRIRMLVAGPLAGIDWHRLPWNGKPLGLHVPVVYGVDLPSAPQVRDTTTTERPRAVLVADPTGSLPDALHETTSAGQRLAAAGWVIDAIAPEHAHDLEVERRIDGAALFHYAGHADSTTAEPDVWAPYSYAAGLVLGAEDRLTPEEILVRAGHVPPRVVLSGCRTGVIDPSAGATPLAFAFLAAGAREVLATTADVTDAEALQFAQAFYDVLARQDDHSLATALHVVSTQQSCPASVCAAYRVFVR